MSRIPAAALVIAAVALAACGAAPADPSDAPISPSPTTIVAPSPEPTEAPVSTPTPAPTDPPAPTPKPAPEGFTPAEQALVDGILRDAKDCEPVRGDGLPQGATAGIECDSDDPAVARIGFYRFPTEEAALDAYLARMGAEGIELESVACVDGEGEGSYVPYEGDISPMRNGCFINDQGYANYRATLGGGMYLGILGTSDDMRALVDFAWRGNQDVPGNPTLWIEP